MSTATTKAAAKKTKVVDTKATKKTKAPVVAEQQREPAKPAEQQREPAKPAEQEEYPRSIEIPKVQSVKAIKEVRGICPYPYESYGAFLDLAVDIKRRFSYGKDPRVYNILRDIGNAYTDIGKSFFMNRAAMKLVEIDIFYSFFKAKWTNLRMRSTKKITHLDLAGGPGGFVQYVQWRFLNGVSTGVSLRDNGGFTWKTDLLDTNRFNVDYGSGDGDLIKDFELLGAKYEANQFDFVTCDGEVSHSTDENEDQDHVMGRIVRNRLLLAEIYVALCALKLGGNFCMKVFSPEADYIKGMMAILSIHFQKIYLFKPRSSRPESSEHFIVCIDKKVSKISDGTKALLKRAISDENNKEMVYFTCPIVMERNYIDEIVRLQRQMILFVDAYSLPEKITSIAGFNSVLSQIKDAPETICDQALILDFMRAHSLPV